MAESSVSQFTIPVFNGDNYQLWAARMTSYLEAMDLWEAIEAEYVVPQLPDKSYRGSNQSSQREDIKEVKGESNSVCCSLYNHFHKNYVPQNWKRSVGLSEGGI